MNAVGKEQRRAGQSGAVFVLSTHTERRKTAARKKLGRSAVWFSCQLARSKGMVGLAILSGTLPHLRRDATRAARRATGRSTYDLRLDERAGPPARVFTTAPRASRRGRSVGIEICSRRFVSVRTFLAGAFLPFLAPKAATVFVERTVRVALGAATTGVPTREVMANIVGGTGRRDVYLNDTADGRSRSQDSRAWFSHRRTRAKAVNFARECLRIRSLIGREQERFLLSSPVGGKWNHGILVRCFLACHRDSDPDATSPLPRRASVCEKRLVAFEKREGQIRRTDRRAHGVAHLLPSLPSIATEKTKDAARRWRTRRRSARVLRAA